MSENAKNSVSMEQFCNVYAAYTASGRGQEALDSFPVSDFSSIKPDSQFEVLYNRSCANISINNLDEAEEDLKQAEEVCKRVLAEEGSTQEEIDTELNSIKLQSAYLKIVKSRSSTDTAEALTTCRDVLKSFGPGKNKDLELMAVAANNLAVLRGDKDLPDSLRRLRNTITVEAEGKLAPSQLKELKFNRCILLLHLRKTDEALRTIDELEKRCV